MMKKIISKIKKLQFSGAIFLEWILLAVVIAIVVGKISIEHAEKEKTYPAGATDLVDTPYDKHVRSKSSL